VAGLAWFAGNFTSVGWEPAAWLATQTAFVHRGLVIQAIVTFPDGRVSSWSARAAVAAGYAASLAPVARSDVATIIAGAALLAGGLGAVHRARGDLRASPGPPIVAAMLFGGALLLGAVVHLVLPAGEGDEAVLLGYQAILCLVAVELSAGVLQRAGERAQLSNLVVELGEGHSGSLRDALSKALGDPTLEVGYWLSDRDRFVDAAGREVAVPTPGSGRAATTVKAAGQRVALIVHDPVVLDDPTLVTAVSRGASLAAANARLQAQVRGQLAELHESRRRLLDAGDEERRRLESDLHDGVERQLTALSGALARARVEAGTGPPVFGAAEEIAAAQEELEASLAGLDELARGLHPRVLSERGLAGAVRQLAASSQIPVDVAASDVRLPPAVEVAAYYVCAEALANVAKYASASHARVDVRSSGGRLTVEVRDDGAGGADARGGTGLRGLADRVEAHGGTLVVESPPGRGTLLVAEMPLEADRAGGRS
jgi:signal transduction histidine kinase